MLRCELEEDEVEVGAREALGLREEDQEEAILVEEEEAVTLAEAEEVTPVVEVKGFPAGEATMVVVEEEEVEEALDTEERCSAQEVEGKRGVSGSRARGSSSDILELRLRISPTVNFSSMPLIMMLVSRARMDERRGAKRSHEDGGGQMCRDFEKGTCFRGDR